MDPKLIDQIDAADKKQNNRMKAHQQQRGIHDKQSGKCARGRLAQGG